jgi:hypothetical protein
MTLTTEVFNHEGRIPTKYSCDGQNVSPALSWEGAPEGTVSYALIMDDPDAPGGTFVHWVLYDLSVSVNSLPEGVPQEERPNIGGSQGRNSFRKTGYGGPCPPGGRHRYYFKLYALDSATGLEPGASADQLIGAMEGHVLAEAQLMGTYTRD